MTQRSKDVVGGIVFWACILAYVFAVFLAQQ